MLIASARKMSQTPDIVEPIDGALSFIYSYIHAFSPCQVPTEPWVNAGNRPWSTHDLHPQKIDILVRESSRNKHGVHRGGNRGSNLWRCVWVGGLTEDFTKETDSDLMIIKAEKLRQAPTEAHTCYKCKDIKTIWSAQDDNLSKGISSNHPHYLWGAPLSSALWNGRKVRLWQRYL